MFGFSSVQRGNYLGGKLRRTEVQLRGRKLKNGKFAERQRGHGGELDLEAFESGGVPEVWRSAVIVPLYKGKGEKNECKNYKRIWLLSVVAASQTTMQYCVKSGW